VTQSKAPGQRLKLFIHNFEGICEAQRKLEKRFAIAEELARSRELIIRYENR
jgi:hypothetical protein